MWFVCVCVFKEKMIQEGGNDLLSNTAKWLSKERPEVGHWLWQDVVC